MHSTHHERTYRKLRATFSNLARNAEVTNERREASKGNSVLRYSSNNVARWQQVCAVCGQSTPSDKMAALTGGTNALRVGTVSREDNFCSTNMNFTMFVLPTLNL